MNLESIKYLKYYAFKEGDLVNKKSEKDFIVIILKGSIGVFQQNKSKIYLDHFKKNNNFLANLIPRKKLRKSYNPKIKQKGINFNNLRGNFKSLLNRDNNFDFGKKNGNFENLNLNLGNKIIKIEVF